MTITPPPSRVYLLRHAKAAAAPSGGRDFDRELDDRGYGEAELVAEKAVDSGYRPDVILSSTAARCRQTAEAMRRALGGDIEIQLVDEIYNGSAETYLALIFGQTTASSVLLVGHNPSVEEALEALVGRERMRAVIPGGYPTAGFSIIDHAGATDDDGAWTLRDFLRP